MNLKIFSTSPVVVQNWVFMLNIGKRSLAKEPLDFPTLLANWNLLKESNLNSLLPIPQPPLKQKIHFTGQDLCAKLQTEISNVCLSKQVVSKPMAKYWTEHALVIRNLLNNNPSNKTLLTRLVKLNTIPLNKTELDQLTPLERSIIIKRMLIYYMETLNTFKIKQMNKSNDSLKSYRELKSVSKKISQVFCVFLNGHSRDFTDPNACKASNLLYELSLFDLENIIEYYFQSQKSQRCIELIAILESKGYYISNKLWEFKIQLLTNSSLKEAKLLNSNIFSGFTGAINKSYEYPHHVNNVLELISRYEKSKPLDNKLYSIENTTSGIISSFIRASSKEGDLPKVNELVSQYWGVSSTPNGGFSSTKVNNSLMTNTLPDVNVLFSIILAYAQNGELVLGLKICLGVMKGYNYSQNDIKRFWVLTLKITGKFGDEISSKVSSEKQEGSKFLIQYELFDKVWELAQQSVSVKNLNRGLLQVNLKYGSLDSVLKCLPLVHERSVSVKFNKNQMESWFNKQLFRDYICQCVLSLAEKGKFLKANEVLELYIGDNCISGRESLTTDDLNTRIKLQDTLKTLQDQYALEKVRNSHNSKSMHNNNDDDDDFELW